MRSSANATVSFGMLAFPVKIFPAVVEPKDKVSFNLLHEGCGSKLKQQYVCLLHEIVVEREHQVKGFEHKKGEYVIFTPEELKGLEEASNQSIEIVEFVPGGSVPTTHIDKTYYLAPESDPAAKVYHLLAEAMRRSGREAIARYAARGKEYLVALWAEADGLAMLQLHREVRAFAGVGLAPARPHKDEEISLAEELIARFASEKFDPAKYPDAHQERLRDAVERKKKGEAQAPVPEKRGEVVDIMAALRASLAGRKVA